jgi:hypothetical protein
MDRQGFEKESMDTQDKFKCSGCGIAVGKSEVFRKSFRFHPRERPKEHTFCSIECIVAFKEREGPLPTWDEKVTEVHTASSFLSGPGAF